MSIDDKILPVIPTWCDLYEMEDKFLKRGERILELEAQLEGLRATRTHLQKDVKELKAQLADALDMLEGGSRREKDNA